MFEVRVKYSIAEWTSTDLRPDVLAHEAAGRHSDWGGAGCGYRDLGWSVPTFEEAVAMKERLRDVGFCATMKEK